MATAAEAVLAAGAIQLAYFGRAMRVYKKGTIDLVTDADLEAERLFRRLVAERFPGDAVLAEEGGAELPAPARRCWILDPLDGTSNFAHGLPIFSASLAVEEDGELVYGAVYDPCRRELFTAERGGGAFLNGAPIRVSPTTALVDAMLSTGFPYDVHRTRDEIVGLFGEFVGRARAVRRLGSAALDLCYVAAGRFDGFWEKRLKPWDTAAGALIVQEAGGMVTHWDGTRFRPRRDDLVAAGPALHEELRRVIGEFESRRLANGTP